MGSINYTHNQQHMSKKGNIAAMDSEISTYGLQFYKEQSFL